MDVPGKFDRDSKMLFALLFHNADIACAGNQGLNQWKIHDSVPYATLQSLHQLLVAATFKYQRITQLATAPHTTAELPLITDKFAYGVSASDSGVWDESRCKEIQRRLWSKSGKAGESLSVEEMEDYFKARERLAHLEFSKNARRTILPWQEDGLRWLIRSEVINKGGLLSGKCPCQRLGCALTNASVQMTWGWVRPYRCCC